MEYSQPPVTPLVVNIRQVNTKSPGAAALLHQLQLICLPGDEPASTEDGWWWIAYDGDRPIGFAALFPSVRWFDCGYLSRCGVVPSARGKGVQKQLIRVRVRKARSIGYVWLVSDTTDNPASSNSLIASGFKLFNPSRPWAFRRSLYWVRKLE
jgi:GNAT superfamily N-acetyltransferase